MEISVQLYNRYAKFDADPEVQTQLKRFFRFKASQETLDHSFAYANGSWDGYTNMFKWSRVATSLFLLQRAKIEQKLGCTLLVYDKRIYPKFHTEVDLGRAWVHQKKTVAAMVKYSNNGGLVINATGTGKTEACALYFKQLVGAAVFIVDEVYLAEQSIAAIQKVLGERVGLVGNGVYQPARITVALIQTLDRAYVMEGDKLRVAPKFRTWFHSLEVIIVDEIHTAINTRTEAVIKAVNPLAVFGLTATLQMQQLAVRLCAIELTGPPIMQYSITQGQNDGHLQKGTVYQIPFENLLADSHYSISVVQNRKRNDLVERLVMEALKNNRTVVVLAERRMHLRILHKRFENVKHEVVSGLVKGRGERAAIFARMRAGELSLLIASRVFFKGVDVPELDTMIDATGLPDANSAVQRFGRGVRKAENKRDLIYMDISDFTTGDLRPGWETKVELAAQSRATAWAKIGIPVTRLRTGELPTCT